VTIQTAYETTTRRPIEIGVGNSQTQVMMEREAIELNMTLRAKERGRLEEGDTVIGVVLGKFGLVRFLPFLAKLQTEWFGLSQHFPKPKPNRPQTV
jgi:hypothetical protein